MTTKQSLVHTPLILTALSVEAVSKPDDYPPQKLGLSTEDRIKQDGAKTRWLSNLCDTSEELALARRSIFSQALPRSIPRQFIADVPDESNRFAIYILTERPLCSCSLARMLRTVSSDARGAKVLSTISGESKDFSIVLAPGYDFSGPGEAQSCQRKHEFSQTPVQTYTLADILAHHLTLLATGTRQLAPGRFLVLVHENWFVNVLLLVEFDVPCVHPAKTVTGAQDKYPDESEVSSTPESEDLPAAAPQISMRPTRTRHKRSDKSGQLGFVRVGADWAENAIRLLRDDASHWADLKEVELTAEWADPIDGYTGTEWQTMGLEASSELLLSA